MNKKGFLKALMLVFVVAVAVAFMANNVTAQVLTTQINLQNALAAPIGSASNPDAYLVDNFEYWCNPRNMGWMVTEPCYPTWGYGLGAALRFDTILDFEEGSRVLDAYRPMSVFLFNTPFVYFNASKQTLRPDGKTASAIPGDYCMLSFKLRAPLSIEMFETFRFIVVLVAEKCDGSGDTANVMIEFVPREAMVDGCARTGVDSVVEIEDGFDTDDDAVNRISVAIGRQFQDSSWHLVMENLCDIVQAADDEFCLSGDELTGEAVIQQVVVVGNQYRLDDIMFTKPSKSIAANGVPHLFRIGPVFGQLFNQGGVLNPAQNRWIMAEDSDLMINAEYTDDGFAFTGIYDDQNDTDPDNDVQYVTDLEDLGSGLTGNDENLKIFMYDEDGDRLAGCPESTDDDANLQWIFTMGDSLSPITNIAIPAALELDPNYENYGDSYFNENQVAMFPAYLAQEDAVLIYNTYEADQSNPMYALACALYNAGYRVFPNAMMLIPAMGQVFEDMIVTCRVSDGIGTDKETFPIEIVNYVVSNNAPLLNDLDDQVFTVFQRNTYQILALDPDPQDMGALTYRATLNGIPSYQVGPWMENIINPRTGLIAFTPISEGAFDCIITVEDPRGMFAVGQITIFCTNPGTWFNHPPVILGDMDSPQTVRAGQMFVADEMDFVDPDGDKLYWSCNIGSVGDNGIWTFQTMYPGYYLVQITAYDIRGGAATTEFVLHVMPWWSI